MGSSFYQDTGIDKDQVKTASQVAQEALERIAALYAVEKAIRGRPPDERHQVRQECSRPVAEDLFAWMESTLPKLSGRSDLAAAMRYALARRENLLRYLDDGCLAIDHNPAERALRGIALGRQKYLFSGPHSRGERAPALYYLL